MSYDFPRIQAFCQHSPGSPSLITDLEILHLENKIEKEDAGWEDKEGHVILARG
jgi:hypothetical protein